MKARCDKVKHTDERKAKRIARRTNMNAYWHDECQSWHVGHAKREDSTGIRIDARYGRRVVGPLGVFILCPPCNAFTAKLGVGGAAKCTQCSQWIVTGR